MKKLRYWACLFTALILFVFCSLTALASPVRNFPVTLAQPDGTQIQCFLSGDEAFNYYHDADGNLIIQNPDTGYYTYAQLNDGKVVASANVVPATGVAPKDLSGLLKAADLEDTQASLPDTTQEPAADPQRQSAAVSPSKLTTGTLNNLVIFLRFSDESEFLTGTESTYLQGLFNAPSRSMKSYLLAVSNDKLTAASTFYPHTADGSVFSYQAAHPRGYYMPYNAVTNPQGCTDSIQMDQRGAELLTAALDAVKGDIPPSLNVDSNGDGEVDNICFVASGQPGAWATFLWPHMSSLYYDGDINGKLVGVYNLQLETFLEYYEESDLCHEMLHTLGFPDLYRYTYNGNAMGFWDVMDYTSTPPQYADTYLRSAYGGWVSLSQYQTITAEGRYTLHPVTSPTGAIACKIPLDMSENQYVVVEYRSDSTGDYDSAIPGSGLIIYRVDEAIQPNGNRYGPPDEVHLFRPGESSPNAGDGDAYYAYLSAQSGRTAFGSSDVSGTGYVPGSIYYQNGLNTGIVISNVSAAGDTISFDFSINKSPIGGTGVGSGTAEDPYIIHDAVELNMIRGYLRTGWTPSRHYKLAADIDLSAYGVWKPICTYYDAFTGTLDGAGHSISGMTVTSTDGVQNLGLFGCIGVGGGVRDLNLVDCDVYTTNNGNVLQAIAGGIVAWNQGDIVHCTVQGKIQGANYVGGIAGMNGKQAESTASAPPRLLNHDDSADAGDTAYDAAQPQQKSFASSQGQVYGRISGCYADVELTAANIFIGAGFAGGISASNEVYGQIIGCSVNVNIMSVDAAGGITAANDGSICDCLAGGSIDTVFNGGSIVGVWWNPNVRRCLGAVDIQDTGDYWAARLDDTQCPYLYYDTQLCGKADLGMNCPRTTAQLTSGVLPDGLSPDLWEAKAGYYPRLKLAVSIPRLDSLPVYWGDNLTLRTVGSDFTLPSQTWEGLPVSWSNSNASVIALSGTSAHKGYTGDTVLSAAITQGSRTAQKSFRVGVHPPVQKITLNITSAIMNVGDTLQLHATVSPADADQRIAFVPSWGWGLDVQGSGLDRTIQIWSSAGAAEPLLIRVVAADGSGVYAECLIKMPPTLKGITLPSDSSLMIGNHNYWGLGANIFVHSRSTLKLTIRDGSQRTVAVVSNDTDFIGCYWTGLSWDGKATPGNQAGLPAGGYVPATISGIDYTAQLTVENTEGSAASAILPIHVLCQGIRTVHFNTQGGGSMADIQTYANTTIAAPADPTRPDYRFDGWYREANCVQPWNFDLDTVTADITLYGKWTKLHYYVTFDSQGGPVYPTIEAYDNYPIIEPTVMFRTGYLFAGWYREAECVHPWNFATDTVKGDLILYAKWIKVHYYVTFDPQNGGPMTQVETGQYTTVAAPPAPVRLGYAFTGWYRDIACSKPWNFTNDLITASTTLYAGWTSQLPSYYLRNIGLSAGQLNQSFFSTVTSYTVNLGENDPTVTITPSKCYDSATMIIDGKAISSKTISLANGKTVTVTVKVTWNRKATTYKLTIKRAKSAANTLSALSSTAGVWSQPFDPSVTNYTLALPENVAKVSLSAARASSLSTVSPAKASYTLKNGQTVKATFKVKAQSGAVRTYTVTITRAKSTNANLASLKSSVKGSLSLVFNPAGTDYAITLPAKTASVTITAKAADKLSTVRINGAKKTALAVKLANGQSATVTVTVTAQSGDVKSYRVTVSRQ